MWIIEIAIGLGSALALVAAYLLTCIRVLNEYERGVIFRLGRAIPQPKGPGLILVFWPVFSLVFRPALPLNNPNQKIHPPRRSFWPRAPWAFTTP